MSIYATPVPVRKYVHIVREGLTDERAVSLWDRFCRVHDWSPVAESARVEKDPHTGQRWLVGRLVQYPGITVSPDVFSHILIP